MSSTGPFFRRCSCKGCRLGGDSTTVDQMLSSASNALMVFVLAQVLSAGQFGIIGLLITTVGVCMGFDRGALGTPLLLTSNLTNREIVAESKYASHGRCIPVVSADF